MGSGASALTSDNNVSSLVTNFMNGAVQKRGSELTTSSKYEVASPTPHADLFPMTPTEDDVVFDYELPPLHLTLRTGSGSPMEHFPMARSLSRGNGKPFPLSRDNSNKSVENDGSRKPFPLSHDSSKNSVESDSNSHNKSGHSLKKSGSYGIAHKTMHSTKSLRSMALRSHSRQENTYIPPNQLIASSSFLQISRTRGPTPSSSVGSNISGVASGHGIEALLGTHANSDNSLTIGGEEKPHSGQSANKLQARGSFPENADVMTMQSASSSSNNHESGSIPQKMPKRGPGAGLVLSIPGADEATPTPIPVNRAKPNLQIKVGSSANISAAPSGSSNIPDEADWIQVSDDEGDEDEKVAPRPSLSLVNPTAQQSYMLTKSGTIFVDGFAEGISKGGLNPTGGSSSGLLPLQDRLVFLCRLGSGASGIVYKALDLRDMRIVALKMIPMFERGKRRQMVRELSALFEMLRTRNHNVLSSELNLTLSEPSTEVKTTDVNGMDDIPSMGYQQHPQEYIVDFYDAFSNIDEGDVALMMEYIDGGSLQDIVTEGGCDNETTLASIAAQALVGLAFLHKCNQLHRDIKPGNFLISKRGFVKIADFGILRQLDGNRESTGGLDKITETPSSPVGSPGNLSPKHAKNDETGDMPRAQTFVGTATYMAPERIDGREYGYPSDIWSFGLSLLTIALGKLPIDTEGGYWTILHSIRDADPPKVPNTFSPEFQDFIENCLQKDPRQRLSAIELLQHPFLLQAGLEDDTAGDQERGVAELSEILWALHQHLERRRQDHIKAPPTPVEAPKGTLLETITSITDCSSKDIITKICFPSVCRGAEQQRRFLAPLARQLHLSPTCVRHEIEQFLEGLDGNEEQHVAPTPKATHSKR